MITSNCHLIVITWFQCVKKLYYIVDLTFLHHYQIIWFKEFEFWVVISKV